MIPKTTHWVCQPTHQHRTSRSDPRRTFSPHLHLTHALPTSQSTMKSKTFLLSAVAVAAVSLVSPSNAQPSQAPANRTPSSTSSASPRTSTTIPNTTSNRASGEYGPGPGPRVSDSPYSKLPPPDGRSPSGTPNSSPRNSFSSDYAKLPPPTGRSPSGTPNSSPRNSFSSDYAKLPPPAGRSPSGTPNSSPRNSVSEPLQPAPIQPKNLVNLFRKPPTAKENPQDKAVDDVFDNFNGTRPGGTAPTPPDPNGKLPDLPGNKVSRFFGKVFGSKDNVPDPGPLPPTPLVPGPNVTIVTSKQDPTVIARGSNVLPPLPPTPRSGPTIVRSPKDPTPADLGPDPGPLPPLPQN